MGYFLELNLDLIARSLISIRLRISLDTSTLQLAWNSTSKCNALLSGRCLLLSWISPCVHSSLLPTTNRRLLSSSCPFVRLVIQSWNWRVYLQCCWAKFWLSHFTFFCVTAGVICMFACNWSWQMFCTCFWFVLRVPDWESSLFYPWLYLVSCHRHFQVEKMKYSFIKIINFQL